MNSPTWPGWLRPAPDSAMADTVREGKSPWTDAVHLLWSAWVFITPVFTREGYDLRWLLLTLLSYPLFVWLYARNLLAPRRHAYRYALGMIVLCLALMPWYPEGMNYFVFGCVMLRSCRWRSYPLYALTLLGLNVLLLGYAFWLDYHLMSVIFLPVVSFIVGTIIHVEELNKEKGAALRLSQDEVRRLAALAERERIGRDLHDLLGHTLSMVARKSDLAGRLLERDPAGARNEIDEVSRVARDALAEVRRAVSGIRAAGIAAELASARLLLETDGVAFDYRLDSGFADGVLPPEVETALALVVREAATNIQRHARARRAEASFGVEGGEAVLRIVDDGRGGAIVPGNGLSGMRERLETLRGALRLRAGTDGGTCLEARVPLAANPSAIRMASA